MAKLVVLNEFVPSEDKAKEIASAVEKEANKKAQTAEDKPEEDREEEEDFT